MVIEAEKPAVPKPTLDRLAYLYRYQVIYDF